MKALRLLATAATVAAFATLGGFAQADTLIDPLHGEVCATGAAACNTDNGQFAPIVNLSNFGWSFSGPAGNNTGNLNIVILAPAGDGFISPMLTGTNLLVPSPTAFVGQWTLASGLDLATFLGFPNSSPANPFGAFQVGANTGVTAFNVFDLSLSTILTLNGQGSPLADAFFASGGNVPNGVDIVAFLTNTAGGTVSTAPSGQLQVSPQAVVTPIPPAIALFGGPLLGLWWWFRRRTQMA